MKGLPASIEIAWGVRELSGRGPKRGLSLQQITEAAVKVASSDGLDAVSMSRVAAELGVATMSLYRYAATKDELLALMVDAVFQDHPVIAPRDRWRAALSRWAREHLAVLRRHLRKRIPRLSVVLHFLFGLARFARLHRRGRGKVPSLSRSVGARDDQQPAP